MERQEDQKVKVILSCKVSSSQPGIHETPIWKRKEKVKVNKHSRYTAYWLVYFSEQWSPLWVMGPVYTLVHCSQNHTPWSDAGSGRLAMETGLTMQISKHLQIRNPHSPEPSIKHSPSCCWLYHISHESSRQQPSSVGKKSHTPSFQSQHPLCTIEPEPLLHYWINSFSFSPTHALRVCRKIICTAVNQMSFHLSAGDSSPRIFSLHQGPSFSGLPAGKVRCLKTHLFPT